MSYELVKANLNLYAVLKNLEDLVILDSEMSQFAKDWKIVIQFLVKNGPQAYVEFKDGICTVGKGKHKKANVKLYYTSPEHLNKMFDGNGTPIPLKGFTKLGFLTKDFDKLTKKMEYYLKPTDELLANEEYAKINTVFTITTAAFAIPEIAKYDEIGKITRSHIKNGAVTMEVLPDGPAATISFTDDDVYAEKKKTDKPMAQLSFKSMKIANDFLNGKSDAFTEIASGNVLIKGQTGMLDSMNLILDRIPLYL